MGVSGAIQQQYCLPLARFTCSVNSQCKVNWCIRIGKGVPCKITAFVTCYKAGELHAILRTRPLKESGVREKEIEVSNMHTIQQYRQTIEALTEQLGLKMPCCQAHPFPPETASLEMVVTACTAISLAIQVLLLILIPSKNLMIASFCYAIHGLEQFQDLFADQSCGALAYSDKHAYHVSVTRAYSRGII